MNNSLIYESRIWVQQGIDYKHADHSERNRIRTFACHEVNKRGEDKAKNEMAEIILRRQTAKGFFDY